MDRFCACLHGRRLRRHRNEPALHAAGSHKIRKSGWDGVAGGGARHRVADLLVVDHRHFDQIRDPDHASRQSRRGRHIGAACIDQSAPRQAEQAACRHGHDRPHRSDPALRRRHHHAGDFGFERNRRHKAIRPPDGAVRGPADRRDPGLVVRHPAQGDVLDRRHIRTGHADLVHRDRDSRPRRNCKGAGRARGSQSRCRQSPISGTPGPWLWW